MRKRFGSTQAFFCFLLQHKSSNLTVLSTQYTVQSLPDHLCISFWMHKNIHSKFWIFINFLDFTLEKCMLHSHTSVTIFLVISLHVNKNI